MIEFSRGGITKTIINSQLRDVYLSLVGRLFCKTSLFAFKSNSQRAIAAQVVSTIPKINIQLNLSTNDDSKTLTKP